MVKKAIGHTIAGEHQTQVFEKIRKQDRLSKKRTTFRLSSPAKQEMTVQIAQGGYGMRGKSKWLADTVDEFLDPSTWRLDVANIGPINSWKRIVLDTEMLKEKLVIDAVNLDEGIRIKLWRSAIDAAIYGSELNEPVYLDISTASVIRAAIMWKISKD